MQETIYTPMTLWAISSMRGGVQVPTFYLDANVQGILNRQQAVRVARDIVGKDSSVVAVAINYTIANHEPHDPIVSTHTHHCDKCN